MPKYFFHLRDGTDVLLDSGGRELPHDAAAAAEALDEARSLMSHEVLTGDLHLDQRIDVEDEQGRVVHRQPFRDALRISGRS